MTELEHSKVAVNLDKATIYLAKAYSVLYDSETDESKEQEQLREIIDWIKKKRTRHRNYGK